MTEDEMVGCHHLLKGHEFQQTLVDSEGQGSLACCSPWGCEELDPIQRLNNNNKLTCAQTTSGRQQADHSGCSLGKKTGNQKRGDL